MNIEPEKKLIVANWKMNGYTQEATNYLAQYSEQKVNINKNATIVICPPFTLLNIFSQKDVNNNFYIGGQDCHYAKDGAYTGSINAKMLKNIGCDYVILGHSERRSALKETNELVNMKAKSANEEGLNTVICVGETLYERENNLAESSVQEQVLQSIPNSAKPENTVIAYEPIWAIGSGQIPTIADIEKMHSFIKEIITKQISSFHKAAPKILYGGSVKSSNSGDILSTNNVDGLLVGKASLDIEEFNKIIQSAI